LTDDGVNAISIAPTSKKGKKRAVQSDLRDLLISNLPMAVGRMGGGVNETNTNTLLLGEVVCSWRRAAGNETKHFTSLWRKCDFAPTLCWGSQAFPRP
jgi:hypothetical protein